MDKDTKIASISHIVNNLKNIDSLLEESKTKSFDFRYDIRESLQEIKTEIKSWFADLQSEDKDDIQS